MIDWSLSIGKIRFTLWLMRSTVFEVRSKSGIGSGVVPVCVSTRGLGLCGKGLRFVFDEVLYSGLQQGQEN